MAGASHSSGEVLDNAANEALAAATMAIPQHSPDLLESEQNLHQLSCSGELSAPSPPRVRRLFSPQRPQKDQHLIVNQMVPEAFQPEEHLGLLLAIKDVEEGEFEAIKDVAESESENPVNQSDTQDDEPKNLLPVLIKQEDQPQNPLPVLIKQEDHDDALPEVTPEDETDITDAVLQRLLAEQSTDGALRLLHDADVAWSADDLKFLMGTECRRVCIQRAGGVTFAVWCTLEPRAKGVWSLCLKSRSPDRSDGTKAQLGSVQISPVPPPRRQPKYSTEAASMIRAFGVVLLKIEGSTASNASVQSWVSQAKVAVYTYLDGLDHVSMD